MASRISAKVSGATSKRSTWRSADGSGGVIRSFSAVMTLWAAVEPVSARASVSADALGVTITHCIRIRAGADVTPHHQFRDGDTVFRIVAIRDRDRRFLDIDAEQRID